MDWNIEYFIFYLTFVDVYKLYLTNLIQNIFLHNKEQREKKKTTPREVFSMTSKLRNSQDSTPQL